MTKPPRLFRLQTHFGTQVYLDPSARLRHGPVEGNPDNIRAQDNGAQLILWHDSGVAGFCPLGFPRAWNGTPVGPVSDHDGSEVWLGEPQIFEVERSELAIGLRHGHNYLCSEPDGRVVFDRQSFDAWERFTLVEDEVEPVLPPVPVEEIGIEELTLEKLAPHKAQPPEAMYNEAIVEAEADPPFGDRAEHAAASIVSTRALSLPPPRPGPWHRLMHLLFGD